MRMLSVILLALAFAVFQAHAAEGEVAVSKKAGNGMKPGEVFKDCPDCPEMVVIPAGSFDMGSSAGRDDEKPVHRVNISKAFALGKTEVTQSQWKTIMGYNSSHFEGCGGDCPVENVSWNEAQEFIQKFNIKTGRSYRLPTEAEWEYACRAGKEFTFCGSDIVNTIMWQDGNSNDMTHSVCQKQKNAYGLCDMSGNVWEWVEDSYYLDYNGAPSDGSAWLGDRGIGVLRGGSWSDKPFHSRAASRMMSKQTFRSRYNGFRLARTLP